MADECKRHKWAFVRNVEIWRIGPRTGSMKLRGLYRCECCGERKHGQSQYIPRDGEQLAPALTKDST